MRPRLAVGEKPLDWIGSAKQDFLAFPAQVRREIGNALGLAQFGGKHPRAKPWKGEGPGVFEVVDGFDGDAYRAIYTVRFRHVVYVLHAFQKKITARQADRPHRHRIDRAAAQSGAAGL